VIVLGLDVTTQLRKAAVTGRIRRIEKAREGTVSDNEQGQAGDDGPRRQNHPQRRPVSNVVLDTSEVVTDTIDYVATDSDGDTATATRTVLIDPSNSSSNQATSTTP
jgi:hypothetical protein